MSALLELMVVGPTAFLAAQHKVMLFGMGPGQGPLEQWEQFPHLSPIGVAPDPCVRDAARAASFPGLPLWPTLVRWPKSQCILGTEAEGQDCRLSHQVSPHVSHSAFWVG